MPVILSQTVKVFSDVNNYTHNTYAPVSYTHLDVYKRQMLYRVV